MFHFPAFPPRTLCVQMRVTTAACAPWRGFPIRTPWDHSPVIDSPRLIADSYVLLRLLMPRHPPCALKNLTTKIRIKVIIRENHENHHHTEGVTAQIQVHILGNCFLLKDARVHYVVLKQQPRTHTPHTQHPQRVAQPCVIGHARETRNNKPTPPAPPQGKPRAGSCCPRTQQCAKRLNRHRTPPAPFQDHSQESSPYWVDRCTNQAAAIC